MNYEIKRRQTTFWDLVRQDGSFERIHFHGKEEFSFVESEVLSFSIVEEHPLLLDYQSSWQSIYLAGPVAAFEQVVSQLEQAIRIRLSGWRSAVHYFNPFGATRILSNGYGKLLAAPVPIAETCKAVLDTVGASFSSLPDRPARWPRQAFVAGSNYVVAKSFRVQTFSND